MADIVGTEGADRLSTGPGTSATHGLVGNDSTSDTVGASDFTVI